MRLSSRRPLSSRAFALALLLSLGAAVAGGCGSVNLHFWPDPRKPLRERTLSGDGDAKILVLPIEGVILDGAEPGIIRSAPGLVQRVAAQLKKAEKDPDIKALLLKIDSPGGSVTACDILYKEIKQFKERRGVPVVACLMDIAASGGYYAAMASDRVVAHPTSLVGSVGVIFVRPGLSGLMDKIGVEAAVTKSGEFKDMGSPFREPTEAEKAVFQAMIDALGARFTGIVAAARRLDSDRVKEVASAKVYIADQALALGMVDRVGYVDDALAEARRLAGLAEDARVVVYRREEWAEDTVYNTMSAQGEGPGGPIVSLGPLDAAAKLRSGFYYLWTPGL